MLQWVAVCCSALQHIRIQSLIEVWQRVWTHSNMSITWLTCTCVITWFNIATNRTNVWPDLITFESWYHDSFVRALSLNPTLPPLIHSNMNRLILTVGLTNILILTLLISIAGTTYFTRLWCSVLRAREGRCGFRGILPFPSPHSLVGSDGFVPESIVPTVTTLISIALHFKSFHFMLFQRNFDVN